MCVNGVLVWTWVTDYSVCCVRSNTHTAHIRTSILSSLSPMFTRAHHSRTFTQLSLSISFRIIEKMYEISFHTKFSSTWLAGLSVVSSRFYFFFGQFESTKLNSIRRVLVRKVWNFSPTKISSFTVNFHILLVLSTEASVSNVCFQKYPLKNSNLNSLKTSAIVG